MSTFRPTGRRAGFTLVELLVVIGIIALLISILLPALNRARQSANQTKCAANLKTIGQGLLLYTTQNEGSLPFGYFHQYINGLTDTTWMNLTLNSMDPLIPPYVARNTVDNQAVLGGAAGNVNLSKTLNAFLCPDVPGVGANALAVSATHYSAHPRIMPAVSGTTGNEAVADMRARYGASAPATSSPRSSGRARSSWCSMARSSTRTRTTSRRRTRTSSTIPTSGARTSSPSR